MHVRPKWLIRVILVIAGYFVRRIELTNLDGEAVDNYDPATNKTSLELDLAPTVWRRPHGITT